MKRMKHRDPYCFQLSFLECVGVLVLLVVVGGGGGTWMTSMVEPSSLNGEPSPIWTRFYILYIYIIPQTQSNIYRVSVVWDSTFKTSIGDHPHESINQWSPHLQGKWFKSTISCCISCVLEVFFNWNWAHHRTKHLK